MFQIRSGDEFMVDQVYVRGLFKRAGESSRKAPRRFHLAFPFGPLTTKAAKAAKLSPEESKPYSLLYTYSLIIAPICGTAGLPHPRALLHQPDGGAAKRTTMWVMILIGIFYVFRPCSA